MSLFSTIKQKLSSLSLAYVNQTPVNSRQLIDTEATFAVSSSSNENLVISCYKLHHINSRDRRDRRVKQTKKEEFVRDLRCTKLGQQLRTKPSPQRGRFRSCVKTTPENRSVRYSGYGHGDHEFATAASSDGAAQAGGDAEAHNRQQGLRGHYEIYNGARAGGLPPRWVLIAEVKSVQGEELLHSSLTKTRTWIHSTMVATGRASSTPRANGTSILRRID